MKPSPFRLVRPQSVDEAVATLGEHGFDAKPLAGGQSLVPLLNLRLSAPAVLIDLNRLGTLGAIGAADGVLRVGALARQRSLERHPALADCRLLTAAMPYVGHTATRNRGTVGGSIAHADAAAELPVCLLALGGSALVEGPAGRREIGADDLFVTHLTSSLEPDELLVEVRFPLDPAGAGFGFAEVAPRHGDYGVAIVACQVVVDDGVVTSARIAAGAVADRPVLLGDAAAALVGGALDGERLAAATAAARAAVDPIDGLHASSAYRRHLIGVLVERTARAAWRDAAGRAA